jgi:group I intron endonuclease
MAVSHDYSQLNNGNIGVYQIKNKINNKIYIGSSFDIGERWLRHISKLKRNKHPNKYLQNSWNKYGEGNFEISVVEVLKDEIVYKAQLLELEQKWLDLLQPFKKEIGYNICVTAGSNKGLKMSEATKEKLRKANLGKVTSEEIRKKISEGGKGKKRTNETRRRMSIAFKGREHGEETRNKISKTKRDQNRKHTEEFKRERSISQMGENGNNAKLTVKDVILIKKYLNEGNTVAEISKIFNVHYTTIDRIKKGKTWRNINI